MALDNASLLSQLMERSQMQRVDISNLQSRNNVFSNTYNSDWSDHSNSMWWEPQNAQQGGYWQPPQPHIQYATPNSSSSIDYNQKLNELICLVQGSQNQDNEAQQEGYWQPYEEFYSTPMQPPQRLDHLDKQIGQIAEFVGQFRDQGELPSSTIANPKGEFETAKEIMLRSDKEVGTDPQPSKSNHKEEEYTQPTERVETPLPEAPIAPMPSNTGMVVPNFIIFNPVPTSIPIPCRFMTSKEEEGEKDILEALPKVTSKECHEFIKEDVLETTKSKEVKFDDIGQVITITCNLAKSNIPETFKGVVFVIEFLSDKTSKFFSNSFTFYTNLLFFMNQAPTLEFKPLPVHFKYHLPFKDQFHAV